MDVESFIGNLPPGSRSGSESRALCYSTRSYGVLDRAYEASGRVRR
jgi:hypothetical protein